MISTVFVLSALLLQLVREGDEPNKVMKPDWAAIACSHDGEFISAAYGGVVYLFNSTGEVIEQAKTDLPKVTCLAFRADSKQLALAGGIPGQKGIVQLYELPSCQHVKTLEIHKDLIQGLAYAPDGQKLATGSYDRLIQLVEVSSGKTLHTFKDHSDAVYAVSWRQDGKLLASTSADRTIKIWDTETGKRLYTLSDAIDWQYAVCWDNDGTQIVAGGADKSIRCWIIDKSDGILKKSIFAHEQGITQIQRSNSTFYSLGEEGVLKCWDNNYSQIQKNYTSTFPIAAFAYQPGKGERPAFIIVSSLYGVVEQLDAVTGKLHKKLLPQEFPLIQELPGTTREQATQVQLPATIQGKISQSGKVCFYRIALKDGEELGLVVQRDSSKLEPVLDLLNEQGQVLAHSQTGELGYHSTKDQSVTLAVRDKEYRGGNDYTYRIQAGPVPVINSHFPLEVKSGKQSEITVDGVNLNGIKTVFVDPPEEANDSPLKLPWPSEVKWRNIPEVRVSKRSQVIYSDNASNLIIPGTAHGRLSGPSTIHVWNFQAEKDNPIVFEVHAHRLGSKLDAQLEIQDASGRPVEQARLMSKARTYITLRDRDAHDPGLRLENWNGMSLNDYLYTGTELLKLRDMPKGPDEDCKFWTTAGKRRGFLGTTPRAVPLGGAIYQVDVLPAGSQLPTTGFPNFVLYYRNDDGGPTFGKDSYLLFHPPADGLYKVAVQDAEFRTGHDLIYALVVRKPEPTFTVDFFPKQPQIAAHGATPITVTVSRRDGFSGPIDIAIQELDPQLQATSARIEADEESTVVTLEAIGNVTDKLQPFRILATASIEGTKVEQSLVSQSPKLMPTGDISTYSASSAVHLQPGGTAQVTIKIERHNSFTGRVPLEVRGLPYGVQVTDVGLNGILITERDTERTFTLKAESWVKPGSMPIVILAKREGKGTEHGSPTILLHVSAKPGNSRN